MSRKLFLHPEHAELGARFSERGDAELVSGYEGVPASEAYAALLGTVGVADVSHRGLLLVKGPEAALYLHGMVTNEVKALQPGEGNESAVINARGRMLGDCRVFVRGEDEILIDLPPEARDAVHQHLDQYLISEDCELSDVTGTWIPLAAWGPEAGPLVESILGETPPAWKEHHHRTYTVNGRELILVASSLAGVAGFELWSREEGAKELWRNLVVSAEERGGRPVGDETLEAARIHLGIPRWGEDLDETTIPLEANLQQAISYTKGCYVGQEVIAKATYRGHVRRNLVRMEIQAGTKKGASLFDGEMLVGAVTSVLDPDPAGGPSLGLGYMRRDRQEVGRVLSIDTGGEAKIVGVPPSKEEK